MTKKIAQLWQFQHKLLEVLDDVRFTQHLLSKNNPLTKKLEWDIEKIGAAMTMIEAELKELEKSVNV